MTNPRQQAKLAQIRALLAKAESTRHQAERDELNRKAYELAGKYGVEESMFAAEQPTTRIADRFIDLTDPYARAKGRLVHGIAKPLRVETILVPRRHPTKAKKLVFTVHMFGLETDLQRVELLYTSLLIQMSLELSLVNPWHVEKDQLSAYRRAWIAGYASEVNRRLKLMEERVESEAAADVETSDGRSYALVRVSQDELVRAAAAQAYPNARTTRSTMSQPSGFGRGLAAGSRADLGGKRVGRQPAGELR